MAKYNVCRNCGAHLDHGEQCDCLRSEELRKVEYERMALSHEEKKETEVLCKKG